jgi:hypothetical protein
MIFEVASLDPQKISRPAMQRIGHFRPHDKWNVGDFQLALDFRDPIFAGRLLKYFPRNTHARLRLPRPAQAATATQTSSQWPW